MAPLNALYAIQIAGGIAFQLLVARTFGVGPVTDVYFACNAYLAFLTAFAALPTEQFMQHYRELECSDGGSATAFYQNACMLGIVSGLAAYVLGLLALPIATSFLVRDRFSLEQAKLFRALFIVQGSALLWSRQSVINNQLLGSRLCFSPIFVLGAVTPIATIVLFFIVRRPLGLAGAGLSVALAGLLVLVLQQAHIGHTLGVRLQCSRRHPLLGALVRSSIPLRLGHQVWSLRELITTHALSSGPAGTISIFGYAWRLATVIFNVSNAPTVQVLQARLTDALARRSQETMAAHTRAATLRTTALVLVLSAAVALVLPLAWPFIVPSDAGTQRGIQVVKAFLSLTPVCLALSIESPMVQIVIAARQGRVVLAMSTVYVLSYLVGLTALSPLLAVYAVPSSLLLAGLVTLSLYRHHTQRYLSGTTEASR